MKKSWSLALAAGLLLAGWLACFAGEEGAPPAGTTGPAETALPEDSLEGDIAELIRITGMVDMGNRMCQEMFGQFRQGFPQVPDEFWDRVAAEMDLNEIVGEIVAIYARHFTREEVQGLIAFYRSPVGRRLLEEQEGIMQECMLVGQAWGERKALEVVDKMRQEGLIR